MPVCPLTGEFFFWRVVDGAAVPFYDCAAIDAGEVDAYGTIEGAIIHGGVKATAFERTVSKTYDAMRWLKTGEMHEVGEIVSTKITAQWEG